MKRIPCQLLVAVFILISGCATNKVTAPDIYNIVVELQSNNIVVTPDPAFVGEGMEVTWVSFDGEIEIEFKANDPKPLPKPTCDLSKKRCKLKIPMDKKGKHFYSVYLTDANGTRHELDPVIIIEY